MLAKIGRFPDTIENRSILIEMIRKTTGQKVQSLRRVDYSDLRRKLARWAVDNFDSVEAYELNTPDYLEDRAADNWEPLFAIAHAAGGDWPALAEQAARELSGRGREDNSLPVKLLADIKEILNIGVASLHRRQRTRAAVMGSLGASI